VAAPGFGWRPPGGGSSRARAGERPLRGVRRRPVHHEAGLVHYEAGLVHYEAGLVHYEAPAILYEAALVHYEARVVLYEARVVLYEAALVHYEAPAVVYETALVHYETPAVLYEAALVHFEGCSLLPLVHRERRFRGRAAGHVAARSMLPDPGFGAIALLAPPRRRSRGAALTPRAGPSGAAHPPAPTGAGWSCPG
jgi:hypothetical protein